jgi:hypothetical protein
VVVTKVESTITPQRFCLTEALMNVHSCFATRLLFRAILFLSLLSAICQAQGASSTSLQAQTPAVVTASSIANDVRAYMATVARDVTQQGPAAWAKHFSKNPSFFIASEGRLAFPSGEAAQAAIPELTRAIKHIELHWGDDMRVDPLAPSLAAVGVPWQETRVNADGNRTHDSGYFTAVVEYTGGHWQFRNAHWSVAASAPASASSHEAK